MADHSSRLDPSTAHYLTARQAHDAAVDRAQPGYVDPPSGLFVMTAAYLLDRGHCCDCGCRHCPWPAGQTDRSAPESSGDVTP